MTSRPVHYYHNNAKCVKGGREKGVQTHTKFHIIAHFFT